MANFRRVDDHRAGPKALGILVPPGQRTVVILRPRALDWDLLPIRYDRGVESGFCNFDREEAAGVARRLQQVLERSRAGEQEVQVVNNPAGDGFLIWVPLLDLFWMLCPRVPGRPYEPCVFASGAEAETAVKRLSLVLWPPANTDQEYYFNTQNFSREGRLK